MTMVTNSKTLIEMSFPFELSVMKAFVRRYTLFGQTRCHQNRKPMQKPPPPKRQLSPTETADGVRGMEWPMGDSHDMPEEGLSHCRSNSISSERVLLTGYLEFDLNFIFADFWR